MSLGLLKASLKVVEDVICGHCYTRIEEHSSTTLTHQTSHDSAMNFDYGSNSDRIMTGHDGPREGGPENTLRPLIRFPCCYL